MSLLYYQMTDTATSQLVQLDARIGVDVSDSRSLDDIITQAGFDFDVEKVPVYNPEGEEVNGQFIIRRADTRQNFAVMRKRYTPIPMKAMLEPLSYGRRVWRRNRKRGSDSRRQKVLDCC